MTKEEFIKELDEKDIGWNEYVEIKILNTNYKWWKFWEPKYETITGLLNFHIQYEDVPIINKTSNGIGLGVLLYFDEIVQVKKLN
jgi:hypothetical protein